MQIDVNDILRTGEGAQTVYAVEGEKPDLDGVELAEPISGEIRIMGTKHGILAVGRLETAVTLECHRCLRAFTHHIKFPLEAEFMATPEEDMFPIDQYGKIDLAEPVRQDIVVHLPLKQLCQADCKGIELKQKKDSDGSS